MNTNTKKNKSRINELLSNIDELLKGDKNSLTGSQLQKDFTELKGLHQEYQNQISEDTQTLPNKDINYTLRDQNLTLDQREKLLNTKMKQIKIANDRNVAKKNMLTIFIIINVVVILLLIVLLSLKFIKKN